MNREVHVRIWERPEVRVLRATRHGRRFGTTHAGFSTASLSRPSAGATTGHACWSHCRRRIFDSWETTKSTVAKAALDQIAKFYAIEDKARFALPAERLVHRPATISLLDAFFAWAQATERKLSARSELAEALRYITKRRTALTHLSSRRCYAAAASGARVQHHQQPLVPGL
jgi:hypothetical protein